MDDADESCSTSLDHSEINDPIIVDVESLDSSKKRKLSAEESDLLPLPKHFCLEQQASLLDSSCSSRSSSSGYATSSIEQSCSKVDHKTQEDAEDFTHMEFISPDSEFAVEDLQDVLNPDGSYILSSARWSVGHQDSAEATTKPTIDQEFEQYFSTLMM